MALEYLACYLFPARGCGNKLKAYFRHLIGSREEGTVDRHRPRYLKKAMTLNLVSVYLARTTFSIPKEMSDLGAWSHNFWKCGAGLHIAASAHRRSVECQSQFGQRIPKPKVRERMAEPCSISMLSLEPEPEYCIRSCTRGKRSIDSCWCVVEKYRYVICGSMCLDSVPKQSIHASKRRDSL